MLSIVSVEMTSCVSCTMRLYQEYRIVREWHSNGN